MSSITLLPVARYTNDYSPCTYSPLIEVGWYGLVNDYKDPDTKEYVADKDRRLLRKLSDQWSTLKNIELEDRWLEFQDHIATHMSGDTRPFFHLLTWMRDNQEILKNPDERPHVIIHPRALWALLEMPGTFVEDAEMHFVACRRQGIVYLARLQTNLEPGTVISYRLHRCEQLVTRNSDDSEENPALGITTFDCFYSVLRRTVGRTRLLYAQKIDCIDSEMGSPPGCYVNVDLFENVAPVSDNMPFCIWRQQNLERLAWARCFMSGSKKELRGARTGTMLDRFQMISASGIPDSTNCHKPHCNHWNKERAISFLDQFLEFVQKVTIDDYERSVYEFKVDVGDKSVLTMGASKHDMETTGTIYDLRDVLQQWDHDMKQKDSTGK